MKLQPAKEKSSLWGTAPLCFALSILGVIWFAGIGTKWAAMLAAVGILVLFSTGDLHRLRNWPSLFLMGYVSVAFLGAFWCMSGKFFLREFNKLILAAFLFLLLVLRFRSDRSHVRHTAEILAGISGIYAFVSVEAASTGITKALILKLPEMAGIQIDFAFNRLYGIFGNPNVEAAVYALGIIFAAALICRSEKGSLRILWTAVLSFDCYAFLSVFSMGALACFAAAILVYLLAAQRGYSQILLRLIGAAIPAAVGIFLAYQVFGLAHKGLFPLLMLGSAALSVVLELTVANKLAEALQSHRKAALLFLAGAVVVAALYVVVGLRLGGPYTFGEPIYRKIDVLPGEHSYVLEADGHVSITVRTVNRVQSMLGSNSVAYTGSAGSASFIVPEDTIACGVYLSGKSGVTVSSVSIDGGDPIILNYILLPSFVAERLQFSMAAASSTVSRRVLIEDGIKLFRLSPILGNGLGSFETGVTRVQNYFFESKYVHNHYVQTLLETGVIGFSLFLASLIAMGIALFKKRRMMRETGWEHAWIYPALCAAFTMNCLQMLWDVQMSFNVYLTFAYVLFALTVVSCAEPLRQKATAEALAVKGNSAAKKKRLSSGAVRIACAILPAVFLVTLAGNLYAKHVMNSGSPTYDGAMKNFQTAATLDLYEQNDAMLSFIVGSLEEGGARYREQADAYARRLSSVQSNTIPGYLTTYYLLTGQYGKAIDAAKLSAICSASNPNTWNNTIALLKQAFTDSADSPLLSDASLMNGLMEYYGLYQSYNARALTPLQLDENSLVFFDKLLALNDCGGDSARMLVILYDTLLPSG